MKNIAYSFTINNAYICFDSNSRHYHVSTERNISIVEFGTDSIVCRLKEIAMTFGVNVSSLLISAYDKDSGVLKRIVLFENHLYELHEYDYFM